jgi:hypothetical protein
MIFCSKNEKGEPAWKLIQEVRKTVTRRLKPVDVGKVIAVQPGRGKTAVCHIKVISCMLHQQWLRSYVPGGQYWSEGDPLAKQIMDKEAKREGFLSYQGLRAWLYSHGVSISDTYRIEFELRSK